MVAMFIPLALAGCAMPPEGREYLGIETEALDGDLVNFRLSMRGAESPQDIADYADCAAAGHTLARGDGFARHVRTITRERAGILSADAVYTISPALPRGIATIDAEVVASACGLSGIPTV